MTAEDNKKLFRQFTDRVWNDHNPGRVGDYFADDSSENTPIGQLNSSDDYRQFVNLYQRAFPDIEVELHEIAADDSGAGCYYTVQGTNTGPFGPMEPTDQRVQLDGCVIRRIEDGKFVEGWHQFDMLSFLVQLGAIELPEFMVEMQQLIPSSGEQTTATEGGAVGGGDKQLIADFIDDIWNRRNLDNLDHYLTDGYIEHNPMGNFYGIDEFRRGFLEMTLDGYPDFQVELGAVIGNDEIIACQYNSGGKQTGDFGPLEPTNKTVELPGCFLCRIEDGKISETYNQFDLLSLNMQLGLIEPPEFLVDLMQRGLGEAAGEQREPGSRPGV